MIISADKFLRMEGQNRVIIGELRCSEVDELPEKNEDNRVICQGNILAEGSIAWVISTGTLYGLTADGEWIDQKYPESGGGE